MNDKVYNCPDCDTAQIEFKEVTAKGIVFFCYYCRKNVLIEDAKPEYLPNRVVILKRDFPALEEI